MPAGNLEGPFGTNIELAARREGGLLAEVAGPEAAALWDVEYRQHLVAQALCMMQTDFESKTWQACWELMVNDRPAARAA